MSANKPLFAFFGTPDLSVSVLDALESHGYLPALIVTAPDRPRGRTLQMTPTPVSVWGQERGIDVITPEKLSSEEALAALGNTDWDVFVVAMYGKLIPKHILDMPRHGCLNVHPSLLPTFRGPSPVLSAILADLPAGEAGQRTTGVTIMQLDEQMDAGPIVAQARIELDNALWPPKGSDLELLLSTEGGNLLAEVLPEWIRGTVNPIVQDDSHATYTKKFDDKDALLRLTSAPGEAPQFAGGPRENFLKICAFDKSPRAHFFIDKNGRQSRVIVTDAAFAEDTLTILRVLPEGKKEMDYADFVRGLLHQRA